MSEKYIDTGRKKQKLKTRTKIIACAQSFVTKGKKFSLEDIAKEAGLSRATIYRYYSNVELLAEEAGLDLDIESPEEIYNQVRELATKDKILKTQEFFNQFTLRNEAALRRFLSVVIAGEEPESKRGARRSRSLELVLKANDRYNFSTQYLGLRIKNSFNNATCPRITKDDIPQLK